MENGSVEVDFPSRIAFFDEPNKVYKIDTISRLSGRDLVTCVIINEDGHKETRTVPFYNIEYIN